MGFFRKLKGFARKIVGPLAVGAMAIPGVGPAISGGISAIGGLLGRVRGQAENAVQTSNHAIGGLVNGAAGGYADTRANYVRPDGSTNLEHRQSQMPMYLGIGALGLAAVFLLKK